MSQECWYSSHLRHTDEFYPCIRPGLKKRKENNTSHQPRTSYINVDIQRKKIINFVAWRLLQGRLIVSLFATRASINPEGYPLKWLLRRSFVRIAKEVPLPDFRCIKGFRISIVKSVSFRSVKGPKRANRRILCL